VERIKKELFHINKKIFIINSKPDITANLQSVLSFTKENISNASFNVIPACLSGRQACRSRTLSGLKKDTGQAGMT